jgi:predicted TIM-barrel fold metal-dependent hydrolase
LRAYNDWLSEFCAGAPGRFIGIALLPIHDMEAAEHELGHVIDIGLPGVSIPSKRTDLRYNSRFFDPLWAMIEESGLPLSLHVAPTLEHRGRGAAAANITMNLAPFRSIWPLFVFSGILERHPSLTMVLTEGGIGWLPSTLYDMDVIYDRYGEMLEPRLELRPSEYWRRQCRATFQEDPTGLDHIDRIGAETILWGADYPHPEGTYPHTSEILRRQFDGAGVSEADRELILGENARRIWLAA